MNQRATLRRGAATPTRAECHAGEPTLNGQPLTYGEYQAARYFPALDGFRAVACLLVITWHAHFLGWEELNGYTGVAAFFVLSGFLITTLALREEARRGALCLRAFYVRRALRIFPAYYSVLALYCAIIYGLDIPSNIEDRPAFSLALPYYLAYMNEYSAESVLRLYGDFPPFFHSWSLGVEEKFYLLWPLLGFALCRRNTPGRLAIAVSVIACFYLFNDVPLVGLFELRHYSCILTGCMLAVLMENRATYAALSRLASPPVHLLTFGLLLLAHFGQTHSMIGWYSWVYPYAVALFLIGLVAGRTPITLVFKSIALVFVGLRTYELYLVHILAQNAVEIVLEPGDPVPLWLSPLYFLACLTASMICAEILHRTVDKPLIALGHRISARMMGTGVRVP